MELRAATPGRICSERFTRGCEDGDTATGCVHYEGGPRGGNYLNLDVCCRSLCADGCSKVEWDSRPCQCSDGSTPEFCSTSGVWGGGSWDLDGVECVNWDEIRNEY